MINQHPDWQEVARIVLLSREIDLLEMNKLTPQGKVKLQFSSMGHELAQVILAQALDHAHDGATVYYRSRPFMLACGLSPYEALAATMAKIDSPSQGRDAGQMYSLPRKDRITILPSSGDVGAQFTPAAGWAQAITYWNQELKNQEWKSSIAVALGGDGSVAANGFWAALNIVTTQNLPLLFFIEDNSYSLSVPSYLQTPNGNISKNLAAYENLKVLDSDGIDPVSTWRAISDAITHIRSGKGPCLLRLQVVRLTGHTYIDDQSYKNKQILSAEVERDPVERLQNYLISKKILTQQSWEQIHQDVIKEIEEALISAEASREPPPSQVSQHLFFEDVAPIQGGLRPDDAMFPIESKPSERAGARINMVDAIRRTLETELKTNPRMLVFGEDVGVKGGVHAATMDLQSKFGTGRVFDTSLSEDGIIGRSIGLAIAGLLPVPEIQFRKYADPAHEQITDLGTLRWRTANRFAAPVVVRIPVGFGKITGDPWHSVSAEAIFAHTLGWRIAYPSNAADAVGLLRTALRSDDPTFILEHRALLDTSEGRRPYPGDDYCLPFGKATLLQDGNELTIVTWGAMTPRSMLAAQSYEGRVSLLDLRTIIPWDIDAVLESVRQTGKVLIVHEDTYTAGFAGEIIATIAEQAFTYLDAPIQRLCMPDIPVPFNIQLMDAVMPSAQKIQAKIEEFLAY